MSAPRGPEGPEEPPWSAPKAGGPLERALAQARDRRALLQQSGAPEQASAGTAAPAAIDEAIARDMAALGREAAARDPERTLGDSLGRKGPRRPTPRSWRRFGAHGFWWFVAAVAVAIIALAAIVGGSAATPQASRTGEPVGLRLEQHLSPPGNRANAKD